MLRTNLATRPFYNERVIHVALVVVALAAGVVLVAGGLRFRALSLTHSSLIASAEQDEAQALELRELSLALQRETETSQIEVLTAAAGEVNRLIDQRVFSWTEFLNLIEATLPQDVRLTALQPSVDTGDVTVSIGLVGRNVGAIFTFIEQLEATGAFVDVIPREEEITEDGMYRTILLGRYVQRVGEDDDQEEVESVERPVPEAAQ